MSGRSFADVAVQWEPVINALYPSYQVIRVKFDMKKIPKR